LRAAGTRGLREPDLLHGAFAVDELGVTLESRRADIECRTLRSGCGAKVGFDKLDVVVKVG